MKKIFIAFVLFLMSCSISSAQKAFRHLSLGLEAGTTGIGLEAALPIVSNHLVLKAGYNYGDLKVSYDTQIDLSSLGDNINGYVDKANNYLAVIPGEKTRLTPVPEETDLDLTGTLKGGSYKAMLEYYPFKSSGFHITGGIYKGNTELLSVDGVPKELWETYENDFNAANDLCKRYSGFRNIVGEIPSFKATMEGDTYEVRNPGRINLGLEVAELRPYLGIGFGRSIPKIRHFGFQFDLGAVYMGKSSINSDNIVDYDSSAPVIDLGEDVIDIKDRIESFVFYPQISFRLIYRIF